MVAQVFNLSILYVSWANLIYIAIKFQVSQGSVVRFRLKNKIVYPTQYLKKKKSGNKMSSFGAGEMGQLLRASVILLEDPAFLAPIWTQLSIAPVPGSLMPSSGTCRHDTHIKITGLDVHSKAVNSTGCFCRGRRFNSQPLRDSSQLYETPFPGHLIPSYRFCGHLEHMW